MAVKDLISKLETRAFDGHAKSIQPQPVGTSNIINRIASLFPFFLKQRASLQNWKPEVRRCCVGFSWSEGGDEVVC